MADLTTRTLVTSLSPGDLLYAAIDPSGSPADRRIAKENVLKDLPADAVDAITEIAAALKSGADGTIVTGTAGTDGNLSVWNADGDLVDGPTVLDKSHIDLVVSVNKTSSFTVGLSDLYRNARCSHASGMTVTFPSDAALNVPDGTIGRIVQTGDGQISFAGDGTSTVNVPEGFNAKTANNLSRVYYEKVAADTWEVIGDLEYSDIAVVTVQLFDDSQDVVVGDGAGNLLWRVPSTVDGFNLTAVATYSATAGTTGTTDVQIHNVTQAADMLSTKVTIDSGETDSATAATPAVINTAADDVATGDKIRFDVDAVSTTAPKGLWVELQFQLP